MPRVRAGRGIDRAPSRLGLGWLGGMWRPRVRVRAAARGFQGVLPGREVPGEAGRCTQFFTPPFFHQGTFTHQGKSRRTQYTFITKPFFRDGFFFFFLFFFSPRHIAHPLPGGEVVPVPNLHSAPSPAPLPTELPTKPSPSAWPKPDVPVKARCQDTSTNSGCFAQPAC